MIWQDRPRYSYQFDSYNELGRSCASAPLASPPERGEWPGVLYDAFRRCVASGHAPLVGERNREHAETAPPVVFAPHGESDVARACSLPEGIQPLHKSGARRGGVLRLFCPYCPSSYHHFVPFRGVCRVARAYRRRV